MMPYIYICIETLGHINSDSDKFSTCGNASHSAVNLLWGRTVTLPGDFSLFENVTIHPGKAGGQQRGQLEPSALTFPCRQTLAMNLEAVLLYTALRPRKAVKA